MGNFRVYLVVVLCVGILAALAGSVWAGEEIKVGGVTLYEIYTAPLNRIYLFSFHEISEDRYPKLANRLEIIDPEISGYLVDANYSLDSSNISRINVTSKNDNFTLELVGEECHFRNENMTFRKWNIRNESGKLNVYAKLDTPQLNEFYRSYLDPDNRTPHVFYKDKRELSIVNLRGQILEKHPECSEVDYTGDGCGFLCNYSDVDIFYDGYWLIAIKKITEKNELKTLNESYNLTWPNNISMLVSKITEREDTFDLGISGDLEYDGKVLTLVHFDEIQPYNLSNDMATLPNYSSFEIDPDYQEQICKFLSKSSYRIPCSQRFIPLQYCLSGKDKCHYILRVSNVRYHPERYGKFIFVHEGIASSYLDYFLPESSYLIYDEKVKVYSQEVLKEAESLEYSLSDFRVELINRTNISVDHDGRLNNLEELRPVWASKEKKFRELVLELTKIKNYYERRKNPPYHSFYDKSALLLFKKERESTLAQLSERISVTEQYMDAIEKQLTSVRQIYYGELGVAVDERAIHEAHEDTEDSLELAGWGIIIAIIIGVASIILGVASIYFDHNKTNKKSEKQNKILRSNLAELLEFQKERNKLIENGVKTAEDKLESHINSLREEHEETNRLLEDQPEVIRGHNREIENLLSNILESTKDKPKIDLDPLLKSQTETNRLPTDILKSTKEKPKKRPTNPPENPND